KYLSCDRTYYRTIRKRTRHKQDPFSFQLSSVNTTGQNSGWRVVLYSQETTASGSTRSFPERSGADDASVPTHPRIRLGSKSGGGGFGEPKPRTSHPDVSIRAGPTRNLHGNSVAEGRSGPRPSNNASRRFPGTIHSRIRPTDLSGAT